MKSETTLVVLMVIVINYHYWSSTKSNGWNSWEYVDFKDGSIYDGSDYYDNNVRAVRTYNGGGGGYISEWLYYDDGMMVDAIGVGGTIYRDVMFPTSMNFIILAGYP